FPRANTGSTFLGFENNLTREDNGAYRFKLSDDLDITALFEDPDEEDEEQDLSTDTDDSSIVFTDKTFQTRTSSGDRIFGSSIKVGGKLDWATRSSFKDAVCAQDGLVGCSVDGLTPVLVLFGETSLFNWNLTEQGIGMLPISVGASFTLSQVDFEQNYAYGTASPLPYDISGQTGILAFDTYVRAHRAFKPVLSLPGRPAFSPYLNIGMSNIWNCTDFDFLSDDESYEYHREHHGVHFIGGLGTDVNFGGSWGARINMDYTFGGPDANLRIGAGITHIFGDY
ncbi:MAG: hypothetical protein R3220_12075, partial [Balneolaceae bacterium]|nr:hypothetical protein [Balneolaceae bacterium]